MKALLDEVYAALEAPLYRLALMGALAVPDIAAALGSDDGRTTRTRYIAWFDQHVGPLVNRSLYGSTMPRRIVLTGENCYRFRCSLLHQGTLEDQQPTQAGYRRLVFADPRAGGGGVYHMNVIGDALNVDIGMFCVAVLNAADAWLTAAKGTEPFETNLQRCLREYPGGLGTFLAGVPWIG